MGDDITIGVTEITNLIEVTSQPTDQIIDIGVTDNTDNVTINVTPSVIEINIIKGDGDLKVPYTGATSNVNLGEFQLSTGQITFDQTPTQSIGIGVLRWNDVDGTLDLGLKGGNVTLQLGQEQVVRIVNKTGVNLTEAGYQAVYTSGAQGQRLKVDLALANSDLTSNGTLGLVTENISVNQEGFVTTNGLVRGINTTGSLQSETWVDGDILYLSPITAGRITNIKPIAPQHLVVIGVCVYAHITQGSIFVKVDNGYELDELHNVLISSLANNDVLVYESSSTLWKNKSISTVLGYTPASSAITISTTSPLNGGGDLSANRTLSISQSNTTTNGYLSSTDWNTFNGKQSALSGTGIVKSTAGTITYLTDNSTNWNTAYTSRISSLTTTGSSGASTLVSNVLNIPNYTLSGLGGQPLNTNLTSISSLSYVSPSFVKMTALGTFALDTNTYLTSTTGVSTLSGGTTGLTPNTATSGAITLGGTLVVANGGTGSTTASGARTNLGATTVGGNVFTSTNPTAITFLRANADNTVSWLDASTFRTAIGAGTSSTTGTVTSVSALTLGTTGTDLSSTVATGTTTPVITLNVPTASATNRGVLSSTDWSTFNGKANDANVVHLTGNETISGVKSFVNTGTGVINGLSFTNSSTNSSVGVINLDNTSSGIGIRVSNSSSGVAFVADGIGTSSGFLFAGRNLGGDTFTVNKLGNVTAVSFIKSGGTSSQFLKADGSVDATSYQPLLTNPITGTGTTNYLPKFTGASALGNSLIYDNGSSVGIGTITLSNKLHILTANNDGLRVESSNSGFIEVGKTSGSRWRFQNDYNASDSFELLYGATGAVPTTSRLLIASNGNVLIGTTTDNGNKLRVNGTGYFDGGVSVPISNSYSINGGRFVFHNGTTYIGDIDNISPGSSTIIRSGGSDAISMTSAGVTRISSLAGTGTRTVVADASGNLSATGIIPLKGYTVSTLPSGTIGDMTYVTDALAPTYNGVLTGGGAIKIPVFYNGTAWTAH